MNILITGGSGFIGTHLINSFLNLSEKSYILNLDIKDSIIKDERLETILTDIRSENIFVDYDSRKKFDVCFHLAALCKEPGFEWEEYFETNHNGTKNVIKLCEQLNIESIHFTSTMMVYQAGEVQRLEEDTTAPDTAYGISKLLAEYELIAWQAKNDHRKLKIVRPAVVFGKNENGNFTRLFQTLNKGFFPFIGKSTTVKSNIYVTELVSFFHFLLNSVQENQIYNFAFPTTYSIKSITNTFRLVFNLRFVSPTLPLSFMLFISRIFETLNGLGLKNSIHHRRIEKLYYSTNIYPKNALNDGYTFKYNLESALKEWKEQCSGPSLN